MKVGPRDIKVEVTFRDNGLLNSMYSLKYLADLHSGGCISAFVYKAVTSWITHHCEDELKEESVKKYIARRKGEPEAVQETSDGLVSKIKKLWF